MFAILALLAASGCKKDSASEKKAETTPTTTAQAKDKKTARADPGIEVPTEEDFEEATEQQITPDTDLNKELDQIEKQIAE